MYIMKLKEQYFNYIKFGTKTYEIRLNDEKRQKIKIGDYIEFQKEPLKEEKIIYKVDDLLYFKNFEELINKIDITLLASSKETKEELLKTLNSFYNAEEQKKYGVVAIKLDKSKLFTIEKCFLTNISSNNKIFNIIKNDYNDFGKWYNKLLENNEECYFTKDKDGIINSILILKVGENDSQQIEEKNVLKIRTFNVIDKNMKIGTSYMEIINSIAREKNIKTIYVTCKKDKTDFINFIKHNGFNLSKEIKDERIYIKRI